MNPRAAKLFVNGGSQAVRLPAEFRFDGVDEVFIRRDAAGANGAADDFGTERPLNEPLKPRPDL